MLLLATPRWLPQWREDEEEEEEGEFDKDDFCCG